MQKKQIFVRTEKVTIDEGFGANLLKRDEWDECLMSFRNKFMLRNMRDSISRLLQNQTLWFLAGLKHIYDKDRLAEITDGLVIKYTFYFDEGCECTAAFGEDMVKMLTANSTDRERKLLQFHHELCCEMLHVKVCKALEGHIGRLYMNELERLQSI